jgi:hypothetical protein
MCFCYVDAVAAVVLHGGAKVEPRVGSRIPGSAVVGLDVGLDGTSQWSNGFFM